MPILAKEPDLYPENLLDEAFQRSKERLWFALYTLARQEKELMRKLRAREIPHYSPMVEQRKRSPGGRIRTSYLPMFTGYVFVCGDETDRYEAVSTGCVSRCLPCAEPDVLAEDLRRIRQIVEFGTDVHPEARPVVGRAAIITSGSLKGLTGTVTQVNGHHRLTVLVRFMQQGASVVIDRADVEFTD
jgi:transcription antitermination factor NusG